MTKQTQQALIEWARTTTQALNVLATDAFLFSAPPIFQQVAAAGEKLEAAVKAEEQTPPAK